MYQLAVVGNPIAHSLSPNIFSEFSRQTGIELNYTRICAPIDDFERVVNEFFNNGGYALNITAPFKARAFAMASKHLPHTLLPATANVLIRKDELLIADNTDGLGLVADFARNGIELANKKILIIGSGSVIFSVLPSLEECKPERIDLLMRDSSKLDEFMQKSRLIGEFAAETEYDIVINTTPNVPDNSLFSQIKQLNSNACAYDMGYTAAKTLFMQQMLAIDPTLIALNGLGMLIQQAKYGFHRMFGLYPEIDNLYPILSEKLHG